MLVTYLVEETPTIITAAYFKQEGMLLAVKVVSKPNYENLFN